MPPKQSMKESKINDEKNLTQKKPRIVFGAKLNLLVDSENDTLTHSLCDALCKKRVKVNMYCSPLSAVKRLPVILIKTKQGETQISFHGGMSYGGARMRISEHDKQTANEIKALAEKYGRDDFITQIEQEGEYLISTTCYYSEERFEKYLMEQARLLVKARVETLAAYPPFAVDSDAQTLLHRNLVTQKVKITDEIVFTDGFCEGDEPEDRILFIELKADENACEIAMEFADALKKLTEAI